MLNAIATIKLNIFVMNINPKRKALIHQVTEIQLVISFVSQLLKLEEKLEYCRCKLRLSPKNYSSRKSEGLLHSVLELEVL